MTSSIEKSFLTTNCPDQMDHILANVEKDLFSNINKNNIMTERLSQFRIRMLYTNLIKFSLDGYDISERKVQFYINYLKRKN